MQMCGAMQGLFGLGKSETYFQTRRENILALPVAQIAIHRILQT
jgi:hypothetical protein